MVWNPANVKLVAENRLPRHPSPVELRIHNAEHYKGPLTDVVLRILSSANSCIHSAPPAQAGRHLLRNIIAPKPSRKTVDGSAGGGEGGGGGGGG